MFPCLPTLPHPTHPISDHYPTTNNHYFKVIREKYLIDPFSTLYGNRHVYKPNFNLLKWPILTFSPLFKQPHISLWFIHKNKKFQQIKENHISKKFQNQLAQHLKYKILTFQNPKGSFSKFGIALYIFIYWESCLVEARPPVSVT